MNKLVVGLSIFSIAFIANAEEKPTYYGPGLCSSPQYECIRVGHGQSWTNLFPDEEKRDLVQRLNRSYNALWVGKEIAVPRDWSKATLLSLSPFPLTIHGDNERQIIVDQDKLAWGAYDQNGQLINWGPIASGRDRCPDSNNACRTQPGIFRVFSKEGSKCVSDIFPVGRGGAKMPYCMYFHKGFALHGSNDMPGYRASHGCVRMFTRDAKWLNEEFVSISSERNNDMGTLVVVRPVHRGAKHAAEAAVSKPKRKAVRRAVPRRAVRYERQTNQPAVRRLFGIW